MIYSPNQSSHDIKNLNYITKHVRGNSYKG